MADRELTFADALNEALREEMARDPLVYLIGEDIGAGLPFGVTKDLREAFGAHRVLDAPISEAAIVGSAVGAAMSGVRPVVDMHFADFVTCAMDEVVNQLAKTRYMFGGQGRFPLTLRMPYGIGKSAGGHHSNSVEAWFLNTPGLKLCLPSTPADAKGLLKTAIRDDDPVLVFEPRGLYRTTGPVPSDEHLVPLGQADVKRPGHDATVIALARMVSVALEAAERLAAEGVDVEVLDPRSLVPLDREALLRSVARTHRVVIVEEGPLRGGVGGHLAWVIQDAIFDELDAPIGRVASWNVPVPFAPVLESAVSPQAGAVAVAVRKTLGLVA
jgi:pyruvate/2-oxoglutarate/acetoin dehydrogenase E1 component